MTTLTRTNRPNTSGSRGGHPSRRPPVLASATYEVDNEQRFRSELDRELDNIRTQLNIIGAAAP